MADAEYPRVAPTFPVHLRTKLGVDGWPREIKQASAVAAVPAATEPVRYSLADNLRQKFPRLTHPLRYAAWLRSSRESQFFVQTQPSVEPEHAVVEEAELLKKAAGMELAGIALSGGGIRSATFGLGILQALAEMNLLRRFDYISSVSGGGYLNSWLTAWIHRDGYETAEAALRSDADGLGIRQRWDIQRPLHFLRRYSNYLTPRAEAFGADQWAAVAIYVRNLLLNLLTLVFLLSACLLVPHFVISMAEWLPTHQWIAASLLPVILILGFLPIRLLAQSLAILDSRFAETPECPETLDHGAVSRNILLPTFAGGLAATALLYLNPMRQGHGYWYAIVLWSGLAGVAHLLLWVLVDRFRPRHLRVVSLSLSRSALVTASFVSGALCGGLWALLSGWMPPNSRIAVWLGPPEVMFILFLGSIIQLGLLGIAFDDSKREWIARAAGLLVLYTLCWFAAFALTIFLPPVVTSAYSSAMDHSFKQVITLAGSFGLTVSWLLTTIAGVLVARGEKTPAFTNGAKEPASVQNKTAAWRRLLANATPYVFASGLLLLLAIGLFVLLQNLQSLQLRWLQGPWLVAGCLALSALLGCILAWRVDVNEFSMHLFYRNRLIRCYLGATNRSRRPHKFTGFDANDDIPLYQLARGLEGPFQGAYPIINATLNLTGGTDLAFQRRKAANFIFSPLFCGYECSRTGDRPPLHFNAYRPAENYACGEQKHYRIGLELGTAMAISGAAASPNMGYYSSKATAFLMTLANVRLGWWLGNPRRNDRWQRQGPQFGLKYLMAELLGNATDQRSHVYISDGGHFENTGLYELVRRRCCFILLCDGARDQNYKFADLSAAIEKCRIDFGTNIEIDLTPLTPQAANGEPSGLCSSHFAVGTISYGGGQQGILLYLKLSRTGEEPVDVQGYARQHANFPHDSTADQWFDEDQFEAYRTLGHHVAASAFMSALWDTDANKHNSELRDAMTAVFGFVPRPVAAVAAGSAGA
jgi:hypothetical protein